MTKKGHKSITIDEGDWNKLEALRKKRGDRSLAKTVKSLLP